MVTQLSVELKVALDPDPIYDINPPLRSERKYDTMFAILTGHPLSGLASNLGVGTRSTGLRIRVTSTVLTETGISDNSVPFICFISSKIIVYFPTYRPISL